MHSTITQRRCFVGAKTSFSTGLTDAHKSKRRCNDTGLCTVSELPTATIWSVRDRFNRCLPVGSSDDLDFLCGGFAKAMEASPLYISRPPSSFMMPLMHWIPEATQEKRKECFEQRDEDLELEFVPNLKKSTIPWVANVLELSAISVRVKWSLESLLLLVFDAT